MESIIVRSDAADQSEPIEDSELIEIKPGTEDLVAPDSETKSAPTNMQIVTTDHDGIAETPVTSSDILKETDATESEYSAVEEAEGATEEDDQALNPQEVSVTKISKIVRDDKTEFSQDEIESENSSITNQEESSLSNNGEDLEGTLNTKQVEITETLKQIISDIDSNIEKDEIHNDNIEGEPDLAETCANSTATSLPASATPTSQNPPSAADADKSALEQNENIHGEIEKEEVGKGLTEDRKDISTSCKKESSVESEVVTKPDPKNLERVQKTNASEEIAIANAIRKIEEEKIAQLKMKELELLKKHEELNLQIRQQQIVAERLRQENAKIRLDLKSEQKESADHQYSNKEIIANSFPTRESCTTTTNSYSTNKSQKIFETSSPSFLKGAPNSIDLNKIFTPATDYEKELPRSRKLFASSAFYSSQLHPTVEDQLELARKISNSLSDTTNEASKGQSMYVNRKKRSVKWIHEGSFEENNRGDEKDVNGDKKDGLTKSLLQLVMNPRGQIVDYKSASDSFNTETGLFSPAKCAEVTIALQMQKGKGAELFAKRRKKVEKWIKDHYNVTSQSASGILDQQQANLPYEHLPQSMDENIHSFNTNVENYANMQEQGTNNQQNYDTYMEEKPLNLFEKQVLSQQRYKFEQDTSDKVSEVVAPASKPSYLAAPAKHCPTHSQRDLAYLPSIPKGWNAPSVSLRKELYVPKEIPLECYAPPPATSLQKISIPLPRNNNHIRSQTPVLPTTYSQKSYSPIGDSSFSISFLPSKQANIFEGENYPSFGKSADSFPSSYRNPFLGDNNQSNISLKKKALTDYNFNNSAKGWNSPNIDIRRPLFSGISQQQEALPYSDF